MGMNESKTRRMKLLPPEWANCMKLDSE